MPLPEEPEKELYWRSEKTGPVKNKDGVYDYWWDCNDVSKGGSTPEPLRRSMDFDKTPILTYLFNITFQNLEFWDVTNLPPLKWISSSRFGEARKN